MYAPSDRSNSCSPPFVHMTSTGERRQEDGAAHAETGHLDVTLEAVAKRLIEKDVLDWEAFTALIAETEAR